MHTRYSPVRRSPSPYCYGTLPLDLHVLGLSLAFILSQDQTLRCKIVFSCSLDFRYLSSVDGLACCFPVFPFRLSPILQRSLSSCPLRALRRLRLSFCGCKGKTFFRIRKPFFKFFFPRPRPLRLPLESGCKSSRFTPPLQIFSDVFFGKIALGLNLRRLDANLFLIPF